MKTHKPLLSSLSLSLLFLVFSLSTLSLSLSLFPLSPQKVAGAKQLVTRISELACTLLSMFAFIVLVVVVLLL